MAGLFDEAQGYSSQKDAPVKGLFDDAQADIKPRSALAEVATGIKAGIVGDLPRQAGQALKWATEENGTGISKKVYDIGSGLVESADERLARPENTLHPEEHNGVTNAFAEGGKMLAPSVAAPLAIGAGLAMLPEAAISGAAALGIAALGGAVPMGMAQAQETYENVKEAGGEDEAARVAGWKSGAIETGGETVGTYLGGKFIGVGGKAIGKTFGKVADKSIAPVIGNAVDTAIWKPFAKNLVGTALGETATEVGQSYGQAKVEQSAGVNVDPMAQVTGVVAPTMAMTMFLAPFGLHANYRNSQHAKTVDAILNDPTTVSLDKRFAVVDELHKQAVAAKVVDADLWRQGAEQDLANGLPIRRDTEHSNPATMPNGYQRQSSAPENTNPAANGIGTQSNDTPSQPPPPAAPAPPPTGVISRALSMGGIGILPSQGVIDPQDQVAEPVINQQPPMNTPEVDRSGAGANVQQPQTIAQPNGQGFLSESSLKKHAADNNIDLSGYNVTPDPATNSGFIATRKDADIQDVKGRVDASGRTSWPGSGIIPQQAGIYRPAEARQTFTGSDNTPQQADTFNAKQARADFTGQAAPESAPVYSDRNARQSFAGTKYEGMTLREKMQEKKAEKVEAQTANSETKTPELVEHVTKGGKGKTIKGIVRHDLTKEEAVAIDKYTFKKDGGFFIREKYLTEAATNSVTNKSADVADQEVNQAVTDDIFGDISATPKDEPRTVEVAGMTARIMPRGPSTMIQAFIPKNDGSVLVKNGEPLTAAGETNDKAIEALRVKIESSTPSKTETVADTTPTASTSSTTIPANIPNKTSTVAAEIADSTKGVQTNSVAPVVAKEPQKEAPLPTTIEELEALPKYTVYRYGDTGRFAVRGEGRRGGGDSIHESREGAEREVVFEKRRDSEDSIRNERQTKEREENEAKAQKEKANKDADDVDGFVTDMKPLKRGAVKKALSKMFNFDGKVLTVREKVKELVAAGEMPEVRQENAKADMTRTQFNRATQREQDDHERAVKAAGKKNVYSIGGYGFGGNGKTAYDYAQHLISQQATQPVATKPQAQPENAGADTVAPVVAFTKNTPELATESGQGKKSIHDFSNTQISVTGPASSKMIAFGKTIPDAEIYTDPNDDSYGRETTPHITVRYGLATDDPALLKGLSSLSPIDATFGKISIFENDKYDVVKVEIKSDSLRAANKRVGELVDVPGETFTDYQPHATIAYVKKGEGKKYVGDKSLEGMSFQAESIDLTDRNNVTHSIKLLAQGKEAAKPPTNPSTYGASNKIVSSERAAELRAKLREKLANLNSGIDPEMLAIGTELAAYHIEAGARSFVKFAKAMAADLGGKASPYLKAWYMGAKNWPGMDKTGMDSEATVDALNVEDFIDEAQEAVDMAPVKSEPAPKSAGKAKSPRKTLTDALTKRLDDNEALTSKILFAEADKAFGGSQAEGSYSPKDAYDAMESAVNQWIMLNEPVKAYGPVSAEKAAEAARMLTTFIKENLPTQTRRDSEMDEFQQFSTPPALAYVASWAANVTPQDTMMEPSAGTGDLVVWSFNAGAKLVLNELSPRRAEFLRELFPKARIFTENAEQINNVLPQEVIPTVVVMNPPFSSTAGRVQGQRNTMNGAKHIEQALLKLADGGRLVAIVGEGMGADKPAFRSWWNGIAKKYNVRANIGISGKDYAKYGTTFDNQILVIDKTGPTTDTIITGKVETAADIPVLLEGIRNERKNVEPQTAQPAGAQDSQKDGLEARPKKTTGDSGPDALGSGKRRPADSTNQRRDDGPLDQDGTGANETDDPADRDGYRGADTDGTPGRTGRGSGNAVGGSAGNDQGDGTATDVTVEAKENDAPHEELTEAIFSGYQPQKLSIAGAKAHPSALVQSSAMAAIEPPAPTYTPNLPKEVIKNGLLSLAQLESVVYAGQAHSQILPNGERRGFFIGDGTGVGKGREIAGILMDNFRQGRKKAVWVSFNEGLMTDAQRDFAGIGDNADKISWQGKTKPGNELAQKDGILFTTYSTLRGGQKKQANDLGQQQGQSRLDQIINWLGKDFDGVIAFDEAHSMGNVVEMKGKRGNKKPSSQALAGVNLQKALPNARVVYVSATGATEISNLGYASRLGLWGEGTPFPDVQTFISKALSGGVAAMELISKDMKALGMYIARSLSFDGVTYQRLEHELTPLQNDIYNELAGAWQGVLQNVNEALEETGGAKNGNAKSAAMSAFWGSHQRFFNQVITSLQTPTVIEDMQEQIAAGHSIVVQLVNTNEATQEREVSKAAAVGTELEELDFTPRQMLMAYVTNSFPVAAYQESVDENGNTIYVPVVDAAGNPVFDQQAVKMRDELLANLEHIRVPENPIDAIINAFGSEKVGEVTGRGRRFVQGKDENGNLKIREEKRGKHAAQSDARAFQNGEKPILIFSQAGGTGFSFHADNNAKNQSKRIHYILQPGWRADAAVQGFGRTHRTNQKQPPHYVLPTTNLKAQKRFVSSIARRLDQLGALTRGQRQATGQGMFSASDNLESQYAADALQVFFHSLYMGQTDLDFHEITEAMGLTNIIDKKTGAFNAGNIPQIPQFLNRLLSLKSHQQDEVFNEFEKRLTEVVDYAIQNGTYDSGMETVKAVGIKKLRDEVVNTDQRTGAETRYVELDVTSEVRYRSWRDAKKWADGHRGDFKGWFTGSTGALKGRIFGLADLGSRIDASGNQTQRGAIMDILDGRYRYVDNVAEIVKGSRDVWDKTTSSIVKKELSSPVAAQDAAKIWAEQVKAAPKTETTKERMIVGVIMPVWDRIAGSEKIWRLQTDDKEQLIGRWMSASDAKDTLKNLGVGSEVSKLSADQIWKRIQAGERGVLANGWELKKVRVSNESRVEILPKSNTFTASENALLQKQGAFFERIQWQDRAFIPTGDDNLSVFSRIVESKPVVDLVGKTEQKDEDNLSVTDAPTNAPSASEIPTITNAYQLLTSAIKNGNPATSALAKMLRKSIPSAKLLATPVSFDKVAHSSYSMSKGITIAEKDQLAFSVMLHEAVHAISVKEMKANQYLRMQVRAMMKQVEKKVDAKLLTLAKESEGRSKKFLSLSEGKNLTSEEMATAYALSSPEEFLSQAFSSKSFQDLLKSIPATSTDGTIKTLWDRLVALVGKALGITDRNMLSDVISTVVHIGQVEVSVEYGNIFKDDSIRSAPSEPRTGDKPSLEEIGNGQLSSPAFKKWFKNSKAINEDGTPITFYHGSNADFTVFKNKHPSDGIYFSSNKEYAEGYGDVKADVFGGKVNTYSSVLSIQNPLELDGENEKEWEKYTQRGFDIRELAKEGYDGVIMRYADGEVEAMAFSPNQIKSALGNNGDFSESDDINRNIDTPEQTAANNEPMKSGLDGDIITRSDGTPKDNATLAEVSKRLGTKLTPMEVNGEKSDLLRRVGRTFGTRIVFYSDKNEPMGGQSGDSTINGFIFGGKTIYLNTRSESHLIFILGHEISHALGLKSPMAYRKLLADIFPYIDPNKYAEFEKSLLTFAGYKGADATKRYEEFVGDLIGRLFTTDQFWKTIAKEKPSLFRKLADAVDLVMSKLRGFFINAHGATDAITNIGKVNRIMIESLKVYAETHGEHEYADSQIIRYSLGAPEQTAANNAFAGSKNIESVAKTMGTMRVKSKSKVDSTFLNRVLSTPEYYFRKFAASGRVLLAALNRRDVRFEKETEILNGRDKDGNVNEKGFVEYIRDLRKRFAKAYKDANDYLLDSDRESHGFGVKELDDGTWKVTDPDGKTVTTHAEESGAVAGMIAAESEYLQELGHSPEAIMAVKMARELTNRGFDVMAADMRKVISDAKAAGLPNPLLGDGKLDEAGRYGVYAKGKGKPVALFATQQEADEFLDRAAQMISYTVISKDGKSRDFMSEIRANKWARKHSGTVNGRKTFGNLTVRQRTDVEMRPLTVKQALAQMGDLRGTYFPRQRDPGSFVLIARKDGMNPIRRNFDLPMAGNDTATTSDKQTFLQKAINAGTPMGREATRLTRLGYDVTMDRDESPVDDVFAATNLITSIDSLLQDSMATINKNDDADVKAGQQINKLLTMEIADIFKARGYLSSRMKRLDGDETWVGYEEDMGKALTQYGKGIAAGTAKRETSRAMILAFTGRDFSWEDYKQQVDKPSWPEYQAIVEERRIDPGKQKNLYVDVRSYMVDILRNQEQVDRIMGTLKGLAVLKFLGFRVSSAAVNATNMVMGVPATMSGRLGISLMRANLHVTRAATDYGKYRSGIGALSKEDREIFQEITARGWDDAQFNQEAARELRSEAGEAWNKVMTTAMYMFGAVERANRAMTIYAAYKATAEKNPGMSKDQIWEKAKAVSDGAHGVYGKETAPAWTRGKFNPLRLPYTFSKFSHNYMLNAWDLGVTRGEYKAAAYLLLSPAIMSGAGASIVGPLAFALVGAAGGGDDPEEGFYAWAEETFGAGTFARHGLGGLAGINLKGSLSVNNPIPTKMSELAGAPGAIISDTIKAGEHFSKGEVGKGLERLLPTGIGSMGKAYREATEGVTTGGYGQVFYGNEPLKADNMDAILRFFSFNPSRLSGIREKQWNEKEVAAKYQERRSEINNRIKHDYLQGKGVTPEMRKEILRYNEMVKGSGRRDIRPMTYKSIHIMLRRSNRANKFERNREN